MTLIDRCARWLERKSKTSQPLYSQADDLKDFVLSERGREPKLEGTVPLVLYFASEEERTDFLQVVDNSKPGMIVRHWP
jgi:hypothetical protein